jgi:hypothetical protein
VSVPTLRDSLIGHWGILFSDPEHFAPHPSTPRGFFRLVAERLARERVRPLTVAREDRYPCWIDEVMDADCSLSLTSAATRDSTIVDFAASCLRMKVASLSGPFVLVLDDFGRCRLTLSYQAQRIDRPRTIEDLLAVVDVLRKGFGDSEPWRAQRMPSLHS